MECAFKVYIAKGTERHELPDKERVNASYTHRLKDLARLAGPARYMTLRSCIRNSAGIGLL